MEKFTSDDYMLVTRLAEKWKRFSVDSNISFWSSKGPEGFRHMLGRAVNGMKLPKEHAGELAYFMDQKMQEVRVQTALFSLASV